MGRESDLSSVAASVRVLRRQKSARNRGRLSSRLSPIPVLFGPTCVGKLQKRKRLSCADNLAFSRIYRPGLNGMLRKGDGRNAVLGMSLQRRAPIVAVGSPYVVSDGRAERVDAVSLEVPGPPARSQRKKEKSWDRSSIG